MSWKIEGNNTIAQYLKGWYNGGEDRILIREELMRKLGNKICIFMILLMTALCLVSAGIAIRITIVMLQKKDQVIKKMPEEQHATVSKTVKSLNPGKLQEIVLYFNGELYEGMTAFSGENNSCFIPVDEILARIGVEFNWYGTDDLVDFKINGMKVVFKLGKNSIFLGDKNVGMSFAPMAAKNHILVPAELLSYLDGFTIDVHSDKKTVFINYYPDYVLKTEKLGILRLINGKAFISDVDGKHFFWRTGLDSSDIDSLEPSPTSSGHILKSAGKVYMIKDKSNLKPYLLDVPVSARWSTDGRYLHWIDWDNKASFVFDIGRSLKKKLGDYYFRVGSETDDEERRFAGDILYDYSQGKQYKRVALTNTENEGNYTFIERKGKTVFKGNASYSPDKRKILYSRKNKGYFIMNADGTKEVMLGHAVEARWISNNSVFLRTINNEMFIYSYSRKEMLQTNRRWNMVGETPHGDIFYTDGSILYMESDGAEKKVMQLPCPCDYVHAFNAEGPFVAISRAEDGVYHISGDNIAYLGKYSLLSDDNGKMLKNILGTGIAYSPDRKHTAFLFREGGFMVLKIMNQDSEESRKLVLDYPTEEKQTVDRFSMKWASDGILIVHTPFKGWIVDFERQTKIKKWDEEEGSVIEGILLP